MMGMRLDESMVLLLIPNLSLIAAVADPPSVNRAIAYDQHRPLRSIHTTYTQFIR